ncbi:MAG: hypothetical protein ACREFN_18905, partial [Acetobacteraceae bacterium]
LAGRKRTMTRNSCDGVSGIGVGRHTTASGEEAIVTSIGTDGRLYGYVPRHFTATWWHPDGRHNLFRNFDLVHSESSAPSRRLNSV